MSCTRRLVADLNTAFRSVSNCTNTQTKYGPRGRLAIGADGALYGSIGLCLFRSTPGGTVTLLGKERRTPQYAKLNIPSFGSDGNLYGTGTDYATYTSFLYTVVLHRRVLQPQPLRGPSLGQH